MNIKTGENVNWRSKGNGGVKTFKLRVNENRNRHASVAYTNGVKS